MEALSIENTTLSGPISFKVANFMSYIIPNVEQVHRVACHLCGALRECLDPPRKINQCSILQTNAGIFESSLHRSNLPFCWKAKTVGLIRLNCDWSIQLLPVSRLPTLRWKLAHAWRNLVKPVLVSNFVGCFKMQSGRGQDRAGSVALCGIWSGETHWMLQSSRRKF